MSICFDLSCKCGFSASAMAPVLSARRSTQFLSLPMYLASPMSLRTCAIQSPCLQLEAIAIYSASVLAVATDFCFRLPHEIGPLLRTATLPDILFRPFMLAQSESVYIFSLALAVLLGPYLTFCVIVDLRYRPNSFNALSCRSVGSFRCWLSWPPTQGISGLV